MYGWMGTILRVNLTNGQITREPLGNELMQRYVGGRGLAAKLLYDELEPGIDPLGPKNKLIFAVGPACGTIVPGSQRWTVSAKSPMTGFIGDSNCGGSFGIGLKYAGYDVVIIEGKSERPLYLLINDDDVQLRDAANLWGKTTNETERAIKREIGDPDIHIASIGTAGDNLVRFANVMNDSRAAGRTGTGAVMGSKRLKAIAARGTKGVKVASPERVEKVSGELYENWRANEAGLKALHERGAGIQAFYVYQQLGIFPVKNYRQGIFKDYDAIHADKLKTYWLKPRACFSCPVACNHVYIVPTGPYAGTFGEGLMTPGSHYTGLIGVTDLDFMFKLATLSDQYGVDEEEFAAILSSLMECFELGVLTAEDLGGLEIKWGDAKTILAILEMTVHREGIGNLLAEGAKKASEVIGKGWGNYVMHVKGMALDSRDPRGSKGWALGYAVSSRGAEHCRHLAVDFASGRSPEMNWLKTELEGFKLNRLEEKGKGKIHKWFEDVRTFQNCLEICMFAWESRDVVWTKVLADIYNAITGFDISASEVLIIGERIANLERAFNIREGLTRKDDCLPDRFLKEPMPNGPSKGQVVNLDLMLDEYYEHRGWEKSTGFPTREKLEHLGLAEIADELDSMGKLARTK